MHNLTIHASFIQNLIHNLFFLIIFCTKILKFTTIKKSKKNNPKLDHRSLLFRLTIWLTITSTIRIQFVILWERWHKVSMKIIFMYSQPKKHVKIKWNEYKYKYKYILFLFFGPAYIHWIAAMLNLSLKETKKDDGSDVEIWRPFCPFFSVPEVVEREVKEYDDYPCDVCKKWSSCITCWCPYHTFVPADPKVIFLWLWNSLKALGKTSQIESILYHHFHYV